MHIAELDTPALVVDLDIMERNLQRVADYAGQHGLRLRPHTKTHKSPRIGKRQLDLGAAGLTVAKVRRSGSDAGRASPPTCWWPIPVIGRAKLERLMEVARQAQVTVALDSLFAARQLSDAARAAQVNVGVLAETDVGLGRVGVTPGAPLLDLARAIEKLPHLTLRRHHVLSRPHQGRRRRRPARAGAAFEPARIDPGRFPPRRHRSAHRQRRIHPHPVPFARSGRASPRSAPAPTSTTISIRCAAAPATWRIAPPRAGHGGFHRAAGPDDRRRRLQDVFLRPPGELRGADLRPRRGSPRRALPQDERRARLRRHHPAPSASFRSATACT